MSKTHEEQAAAYDEICRIAREHALISKATGGVVVLDHPGTQKADGLYGLIQYMQGLGPHSGTLKQTTPA